MKPGRLPIVALLLSWLLAGTAWGSPTAPGGKPVFVYYMPWFAAKPYSTNWGWHWTMDHFNPDLRDAAGQQQIASWYYPLIGPYDSTDPTVLEYHVLLMRLAGIDGVMVDWYGSTEDFDYGANNRATARLFDFTRKAGLKFAICYEDQTIQHLISAGRLGETESIRHAQQEMLYLQTNYFGDPSYFRVNGQPLLQNFGPQYFQASTNWEEIFSVLAPSNHPALFTEDNRLAAGLGAFDWPPMWMSQLPGTGGVLSGAALNNYLAGFEKRAEAWPGFIASAFPRFHDIYQRAGVRNYWGYLGDRNGQTLRETLGRAVTNASAMVLIVTWNDFGEGTAVEPTTEYGFRDLGLIQDFRSQFIDPQFHFRTNDLALAVRLYQLRRRVAPGSAAAGHLDEAFTNLAAGNIQAAQQRLQAAASPTTPGF